MSHFNNALLKHRSVFMVDQVKAHKRLVLLKVKRRWRLRLLARLIRRINLRG